LGVAAGWAQACTRAATAVTADAFRKLRRENFMLSDIVDNLLDDL
jgi:hypothetical protein